jgi:hypothetical protein
MDTRVESFLAYKDSPNCLIHPVIVSYSEKFQAGLYYGCDDSNILKSVESAMRSIETNFDVFNDNHG